MIAKARFGVNPVLGQFVKNGGPIIQDIRDATRKGAEFWHKNQLKGHFEPGASRKYPGDYTRRSRKYIRRKAKEGRAPGTMRYTGTMRRTILGGRLGYKDARGAKTLRVRVTLPFARAANLWTGKRITRSNQAHNFARELRAMNRKDVIAIERVIENEITRRLGRSLKQGGRRIIKRKVA